MNTKLLFAAAAALGSASLPAQVMAGGGAGERAATTVIWFEKGEDGNPKGLGGMNIQYGQPPWQAKYDEMADKAKGQHFRLGKDWWTTFDTTKDLDFSGVRVPAGSYFLALECDQDGKFKLDVIRSGRALQSGALPIPADATTADFAVPMNFEKGVLKEPVQKLTIALSTDKADPMKVTIEITWGTHRLTASGKASTPEPRQGRGGRQGGGGKGGKGGEGKGGGGGESKGGGGGDSVAPDVSGPPDDDRIRGIIEYMKTLK